MRAPRRNDKELTMDSMSQPAGETDADRPAGLNVGDPELRKTRLLARECATCIFNPATRCTSPPAG